VWWLIGLAGIAAGQILNGAIYVAIGKVGKFVICFEMIDDVMTMTLTHERLIDW
jgi:hypothetical protein